MGLFDKIFPKKTEAPRNGGGTFSTLTAYRPSFTSWDGKLYESELVRAAIDARARHISKLQVQFDGGAKPGLRVMLRRAPNEWQTWSQFLYRLSTILDMQGNAFIVPVLNEELELTGFFPVLPTQCELVDVDGEPFLRYRFSTGKTASIELSNCGIMTRHQYEDDIFGTGNGALRQTMELISMQTQGIKEGIKNSATFRFMARLDNFSKDSDLAKERRRFDRENLEGESGGLLLFPNTYSNISKIESKPFVADTAQMELIRTNVNTYFGVNDDILQNRASGDQLDAFFDGAIEPFCIQLSDVLTRMTFSTREVAYGNRVTVTANRLQYMGTANKISMAKELGDRGILMIDEIRELFNYAPMPDGAGQHAPIRGEYYMVDEGKNEPTEGVAENAQEQ